MLLGIYRFRCAVLDDTHLPPFKGSTFRGAFGAALKRAVCVVREKECQSCLLASRCLYARTFESRRERERIGRTPPPPLPYVIEPPADPRTRYVPGDVFDFSLLLFGETNDYLPYFVYAFEVMGERGIGRGAGKGAGRFAIDSVWSGETPIYDRATRKLDAPEPLRWQLPPAATESARLLTVSLLTPLRLKSDNRLQAQLPFSLLVRAALRRISALCAHHGEGEPPLDYKGLIARAADVETVESRLRWNDWKRWSNRQEEEMFMGGMIGEVVYRDVPGDYLPLLSAARLFHIGKQTTFGLGRITYQWRTE